MKKNSLKKWGFLSLALMTGLCFPVAASAAPYYCSYYGSNQCVHGIDYTSCDTCMSNGYCLHGELRANCQTCLDNHYNNNCCNSNYSGGGHHRGGGRGHHGGCW